MAYARRSSALKRPASAVQSRPWPPHSKALASDEKQRRLPSSTSTFARRVTGFRDICLEPRFPLPNPHLTILSDDADVALQTAGRFHHLLIDSRAASARSRAVWWPMIGSGYVVPSSTLAWESIAAGAFHGW